MLLQECLMGARQGGAARDLQRRHPACHTQRHRWHARQERHRAGWAPALQAARVPHGALHGHTRPGASVCPVARHDSAARARAAAGGAPPRGQDHPPRRASLHERSGARRWPGRRCRRQGEPCPARLRGAGGGARCQAARAGMEQRLEGRRFLRAALVWHRAQPRCRGLRGGVGRPAPAVRLCGGVGIQAALEADRRA